MYINMVTLNFSLKTLFEMAKLSYIYIFLYRIIIFNFWPLTPGTYLLCSYIFSVFYLVEKERDFSTQLLCCSLLL